VTDASARRRARIALFAGCNLAIALALWSAVVGPALNRLASQNARIRSDELILANLRAIAASAPRVAEFASRLAKQAAGGEFLSGANEGVVDAALQARLKSLADRAHARVRSLQSLTQRTLEGQTYSGARIELSGAPKAVLATVYHIENSHPLLFVTAAIVRAKNSGRRSPGEAPKLEAQFDVYGAWRERAAHE